MTKAPRILVLGHHGCGARQVRVHHIPAIGETVEAWDFKIIKDGGKGSHQAMVIGRLGGDVGFIGKIATDEQANVAKQWLIDDHVDVTHLLRAEYKLAGSGMIMLDDEGNNAIVSVPGLRKTLTFDEVRPCIEDFDGSKIFITGFEIPVCTALDSAKLAKRLGMLTILNPAPVPPEPVGVLEYIDIIIPNELEAKVLAGFDVRQDVAPLELAKAIKTRFQVGSVIITLGSNGSMAYDGVVSWQAQPLNVPVVDTTGAGDAYIGAFAFAYDKGMGMRASMEWANSVAALSVTRSGSILSFPTLAEVQEFIDSQSRFARSDCMRSTSSTS